MKCVFCNKEKTIVFATGVERGGAFYQVIFCTECHNGFADPFPSSGTLASFYATGTYRGSEGRRFNRWIEYGINRFMLGRKNRIVRMRRPGKLLDIGCGRGSFLAGMRDAGWDVAGVEFSEETASHAREPYGVPVATDLSWPDGSFDVITINHVLEHIHDPVAMLRGCRRLLKADGLIVVAVPNIASMQAQFGRGKWFHLDVPCHLFQFSEQGLVGLLQAEGFRIVRTKRFDLEHNPFGWLQTMLNCSGIRENFLYNLLKRPELRQRELAAARMRDYLLTLFLLPLYAPVSLGLAILEAFLKRGGTVEMWGVKV
ncbi:MAG: class I SAM-dependent methyltransferase [Geobacter sp.]|nr:class I SAM-dependent methyltransferase [Geobacter sp.]